MRIIQVQIDFDVNVSITWLLKAVMQRERLKKSLVILFIDHVNHYGEDDGPHGQAYKHYGIEHTWKSVLTKDILIDYLF